MMADSVYIKVLLLVYLLCKPYNCEQITYELSVTTPEFSYEKIILNQEVVTSKKNAFSITILSNFTSLHPGVLNITADTFYFWMDSHNLETIQPGVFDDQNITEEIRLSGNKLTVISSGTFKNLKIKKIDLSNNKITRVEEDAISNLPNLFEVHLSRNEITTFHENSFVNTPKMWVIDLTHNKLKMLGPRWFSFMKKNDTVIVGASFNEIEEVDPRAFEEIEIWNLDLSHNKLKTIPEGVFKKNPLMLLVLNNNDLSTLPETFFGQKALTDVDVRGNPLHCDVQKKLDNFRDSTYIRIFYDGQTC